MPRPTKYFNSRLVKTGIPIEFDPRSGEVPPSSGIPFIGIDSGNSTPKFIRPTTVVAP